MVRAKFVYGLGTVVATQGLVGWVDAFQTWGVREVLKLRHPCVDRANTNQRVMEVSGRVPVTERRRHSDSFGIS